ncbi:MAG: HEAT repeat domain-containing protein [Lachnospiraceae bacterium]|nr:HEAT repeat domain-containing protein [Lachnospiraceae bacterium]
MINEKVISKIDKAVAKKKSKVLIKMLKKTDKETLIKLLEAMGQIADEDSNNHITHYLDYDDNEIRTAACEAALTVNTEYMRTRVRHQLSKETDAAVKAEIQKAFNKARKVDMAE